MDFGAFHQVIAVVSVGAFTRVLQTLTQDARSCFRGPVLPLPVPSC